MKITPPLLYLASFFCLGISPAQGLDTAVGGAPAPKGLEAQLSSGDFKKAPTFITSASLTVKSDKRVFVYTGGVVVKQGDMTLTCEELEGRYTENNQIDELIAKRNILITKGPTIRATGQKGVYTASTGTLVLTDNPSLEQNGSTLSADVIRVFMHEDRSVAEGDVRMKLINNKDVPIAPVAAVPSTPTPIPAVSVLGN